MPHGSGQTETKQTLNLVWCTLVCAGKKTLTDSVSEMHMTGNNIIFFWPNQ